MVRNRLNRTRKLVNLLVTLVLTVIFFGANTAPVRHIVAQDSSGTSREIFDNGDEEIVKWEQVSECVQDSKKISDLTSKEKSLYAESSQVINELDSLTVIFQPTDAQKVRISELKAKHAKIEADLAANNAKFQALSNKTGPSDECKTAFVKSVVKNMTKRAEKPPTFLAKLETTSQLIAKIEKALPDLKKASSNETLIKSIEDDIKTINTTIAALRSFFEDIKKEMDEFTRLYNTNPVAAYDEMNKFGKDDSKFKKAESAAESMVSALSRLEKSLETLANSTVTPTPTPSPIPTN